MATPMRGAPEPPDSDVEQHAPGVDEEVPTWVFVSHTGVDEQFIRAEIEPLASPNHLALHLVNGGSSPVVAQPYKRQILRSLARCKWFLVVVSKAAVSSRWVGFEVDWAMANRPSSQVIVVRRDCLEAEVDQRLEASMVADFRFEATTGRESLQQIFTRLSAA